MKNRIQYIILSLAILAVTNLKADIPYKGQGQLDMFTCFLKTSALSERMAFCMDNSKSSSCDYAQGDAAKMLSGNADFNAYIVADDNGDALFMKYKPYSSFYVDFKLEVVVRKLPAEPYVFTLGNIVQQSAMKVVQLVDLEKPESEWVNILTTDYTFTLPATGKYSDRFYIRVYGADIPKFSATPLDWNKPANWQSEKLPQSNSHVHIPNGTSLRIQSGDNINIELLTTLGYLENNGTINMKTLEFY